MNFNPLFTTAKVANATYSIASSVFLLVYIINRARKGEFHGRRIKKAHRVE